MTGDLDGELRGLVERWRIAGARLAALRRAELRKVEVADQIESLDGAFAATLAGPVRTTSGLVQQQQCATSFTAAGLLRRTSGWPPGLRERLVILRHVIKNALIPVVTLVGLQVPIIGGGAVAGGGVAPAPPSAPRRPCKSWNGRRAAARPGHRRYWNHDQRRTSTI